MRDPEAFDAFYADTRERLLLQTYALTGDLRASRTAVRQAYVAASHHWRKVSRAEDPEALVRGWARAHAQRRHAVRLVPRMLHDESPDDPAAKAVLDALGKLSTPQRTMLVLTALSSGTLDQIAREAGLTTEAAGVQLQHATAQVSLSCDIPSAEVPQALDTLRSATADVPLPRATIVRRAGAARRRTHTVVGVTATAAILVASGLVVSHDATLRPALAQGGVVQSTAPASDDPGSPAVETDATLMPEDLLTVADVTPVDRKETWTELATTGGNEDDPAAVPCRQAAYADPDAVGALVRTFRTEGPKRSRQEVTETAELSADEKAAAAGFDTTVDWYAGCVQPSTRLLGTYAVDGVGDVARLFTLQDWGTGRVVTSGIARTGRVTVSVVTTAPAGTPDRAGAARLLARAVGTACHAEGGGACAVRPRVRVRAPYPIGEVPALLSEVDLPPVGAHREPWVGTTPRKARVNLAASGCARAVFATREMSRQVTRSFVIPTADLPTTFGITQTAGAMAEKHARLWVSTVRSRLAQCDAKGLGTSATLLSRRQGGVRDLLVWRITTETSEQAAVTYLMAIVRNGTALSQIGFIPAAGATMGADAFTALATRAQQRLTELPEPVKVADDHDHEEPDSESGSKKP